MKRKSVVFMVVLALFCSVFTAFALTGCSDEPEITDVSTAEEFAAAEGIVRLTNDIDFGEAHVSCNKVVYGEGHTLSNAVMTTNGFQIGTKDVTIENFTLKGKNMSSFGFVTPFVQYRTETDRIVFSKYYLDAAISNVHIKNCKAELELNATEECYIGGLLGKTIDGNNSLEPGSTVTITNCSVEGLEITATRPAASSFWDKSGKIYFGGLVGSGIYVKMSDCSAKNCTFSVTGGHVSDDIRMGGLIGYMQRGGELTHCYVKDTEMQANNTLRTGQDVLGGRITAHVRVGGLAGDGFGNSKITACYSESNRIVANSSGKSYVGGIIGVASGTVSQCYAVDNTLTCKGRAKDDADQSDIRVGGIAGAAEITNVSQSERSTVAIKSSFAFNNTTDIELKDTNAKYFYLSDQKITVCKDFFGEYLALYKDDPTAAAQFLTDTLNRDDADKGAVQQLIDDLEKRFTDVGTDYDSVSYYINTYYSFLNDEYNKLDHIYVGGLLGTAVKNAKVDKCAAGMTGTHCHYDRFCRTVLETADYNKDECYITSGGGVNNRHCATLTDEQTHGNSLVEKLQLTDEKWTVSDGGLPTLALN